MSQTWVRIPYDAPSSYFNAPVTQLEECDASNVVVAGSSPARSSNFNASGSDVAGNMRAFQARFESSNLSSRSN
jgi:hypothetical protein